ncbi:hypothetical protein CYMTET_7026, partial [Cymbomonas tetramitiformis]
MLSAASVRSKFFCESSRRYGVRDFAKMYELRCVTNAHFTKLIPAAEPFPAAEPSSFSGRLLHTHTLNSSISNTSAQTTACKLLSASVARPVEIQSGRQAQQVSFVWLGRARHFKSGIVDNTAEQVASSKLCTDAENSHVPRTPHQSEMDRSKTVAKDRRKSGRSRPDGATYTEAQFRGWEQIFTNAITNMNAIDGRTSRSKTKLAKEFVRHTEVARECEIAVDAWREAAVHGCVLSEKRHTFLLHMLTEACNSSTEIAEATRFCNLALEVVETLHPGESLEDLPERPAYGVISCLCKANRTETALKMLHALRDRGQLKGRTFSPVLASLTAQAKHTEFRAAWEIMLQAELSPPEEHLVSAVTISAGDKDALRYYLRTWQETSWPSRVSQVAAACMMEALGPTRARTTTMHKTCSGLCPLTGTQLKLVNVNSEERREMRAALLTLALEKQGGLYKGRRTDRSGGAHAQTELFRMKQNLEAQFAGRPPVRFIVDGANVAYWEQNKVGGDFSFQQIHSLLEHL